MRTCIYCKKEKSRNKFPTRKNPTKTDTVYIHPVCYECGNKRTKEWVKNNREKHLAYQRSYNRKRV